MKIAGVFVFSMIVLFPLYQFQPRKTLPMEGLFLINVK